MRIDLNADVGESFGAWTLGDDAALIPLVTSVNIACGTHAGDPLVMARTVARARAAGAAIGAHPGYPDLAGFGRREMELADDELQASLLYQIGALAAIVRAGGAELHHVKPHGALYNRAARDPRVAGVVARSVAAFSRGLVLVGLAGSQLIAAAEDQGLRVAPEAFADRAYEADGTLRSRSLPGAVHASAAVAAEQAVSIARDGRAVAHDGAIVPIHAATLCVHGDTPDAAAYARAIRDALGAAGVSVEALGA